MSHATLSASLPVSENRARLLKTLAYFATYIAMGLSAVVLGLTLQELADHTASRLNQISILFSARAFGYMLGSFFGGRVYDRFAGNPLIASGLVVMAVMLSLVPLIPLLWLLVAVIVLLGIGEGGVDAGGNTMLLWTHGSRVGPYMNGLHFCWGAGAFICPIIMAQAVLMTGNSALGYWLIALLTAAPAIFLLRLPSPAAHTHAADRPGGPLNVKLLALIMIFYFTYVGAEGTFAGWIYSYALAIGLADKAGAAYLTSLFLGALTLGRLLAIPVAARVAPQRVLLGDLVGSLACLGLMLGLRDSATVLWLGALGTGLFMASMFPTMISFADRRMAVSGQITGLFLFASAAGGITFPWLVGQLFEPVGPIVTVVVIFACAVAELLAFVAILHMSPQAARPQ